MRECLTIIVVLLACAVDVQAVSISLVTVGNAGNAVELSGTGAGGYGPDAIVGGVAYSYNIGKYVRKTGQVRFSRAGLRRDGEERTSARSLHR